MSLDPSPASIFENARRSYGTGAFDDALRELRRVPLESRTSREYLLLCGACFARTKQPREAIAAFRQLLEIDLDSHEALTWMAVLTKDLRNMEESLGYARRAVELRPDDATSHGALGVGYLAARLPDPAIASLRKAVELAPKVAEHRHNLALAYLMAHRHDEAIAELRKAIELAPQSPQNYLVLASTYSLFGMAGPAIECLSQGIHNLPRNAGLHSSIAGIFAMIRNDEAAEHHHQIAIELSPESRGSFAMWLLNQGRFAESTEVFEEMAQEGADPAYAYYGMMQSRKLADSPKDADFFGRMQTLASTPTIKPRSEMYLRYALGRAEEQRKNYESAMAHFDAANGLANVLYHSGTNAANRFKEEHDDLRNLYESLVAENVRGDSSEAPIFVIGMIRSGTTLLDQIVSSHHSVASGGELRFWMEEGRRQVLRGSLPTGDDLSELAAEYMKYSRLLAGDEERITDKMPLNFAYAGLINRAMPKAQFIHIRRHPVDTCLSIWTTFFGQGPSFAYDKGQIVSYYREYLQTMAYWRSALPADRLLEIDYEELIADPQTVVPRIVEFLGLPWDDACLHHDQNQSAINTPSRWQARQPIYRTSLERWRRHEPWLGEFAELLEAQ